MKDLPDVSSNTQEALGYIAQKANDAAEKALREICDYHGIEQAHFGLSTELTISVLDISFENVLQEYSLKTGRRK